MDPLDPCSPPDLRHLVRLTDDFGVLQHTQEETPLPEFGYAIDDVARALVVVLWALRQFPGGGPHSPSREELLRLAERYLQFIEYCQRPDGRFHNFVKHDRSFPEEVGSMDAFGRTLWALGEAGAAKDLRSSAAARAVVMFQRALPNVGALSYPRAKAFAVLGLVPSLKTELSEQSFHALPVLVRDLVRVYEEAATEDWPWFEDTLRYSNAGMVYGILLAAGNAKLKAQHADLAERAKAVGLRALGFLLKEFTVQNVPSPPGNKGWRVRGGERPLYDQQCVDAAAMAVACAEAFCLTGDQQFREAAFRWWGWFFGNNINKMSLYRPEDGAVYDGLTPEGVNANRGAESVIAFLIAHLKLAQTLCPT